MTSEKLLVTTIRSSPKSISVSAAGAGFVDDVIGINKQLHPCPSRLLLIVTWLTQGSCFPCARLLFS